MNEALILALGVALSPLPIAVLTMILSGRHPRQLGVVLRPRLDRRRGRRPRAADRSRRRGRHVGRNPTLDRDPRARGRADLRRAAHIWRTRRRRGESRATPRWLAAIDGLTPARSAGLGLVLASANPKNLGIAIALAEANVSGGATLAAALGFAAIGTLGVAVPLAFSAAAPGRSGAALERFRAFLLEYDALVLTLLGVAIGAKLAYDGFTAL